MKDTEDNIPYIFSIVLQILILNFGSDDTNITNRSWSSLAFLFADFKEFFHLLDIYQSQM